MCIDGMFGMSFFVKIDVSRLHGKFQTCHRASHPLLFGSIFIGNICRWYTIVSLYICFIYCIDILYIIVFIYYLNKFVFIIYILHTYICLHRLGANILELSPVVFFGASTSPRRF